MENYLKKFAVEVPEWLKNHKKGDKVNMLDVLNSRTLYYPGSGLDGQPIRTLNTARAAQVFIYVDYGITVEKIENDLNGRGINGYHQIDKISIHPLELTTDKWRAHIYPSSKDMNWILNWSKGVKPFVYLYILERDEGLDDSHGNERIAILFIHDDGISCYDSIFCSDRDVKPPFILILQDHGSGGNYSSFGEGGLMSKIAHMTQVYPDFSLVATNTKPWKESSIVENVESVFGGMWTSERKLFKHI